VRFVRPIAIEPDHTEIDAPIHAGHAGVFGDRVIDLMSPAVIDQRDAAAEPPQADFGRNGVASPPNDTDSVTAALLFRILNA